MDEIMAERFRDEGRDVAPAGLVRPGDDQRIWRGMRVQTRHTHGAGCTLASAIATFLGQGQSLVDAVEGARRFVRAALIAAPGFGAGHGPLGHQAVR